MLGANHLGEGRCRFRVWAPLAEAVDLHLVAPEERFVALLPEPRGTFSSAVENVFPGAHYMYRLRKRDGRTLERPDPASRSQPEGVHGPSEVVAPDFPWTDATWRGIPLSQYIIYELHVGTFSNEGTFAGVIPRLDALRQLGITAVELMPVAQFPGGRNWGYDGAYPFAAQNTYGGPTGLKNLVDACHERGLAVILDAVYNHLGPEGNYLADFAPYFTDHYKTPWGAALNFDGPHSDGVRQYFLENALHWVTDFHIDALRLDAVHAIVDASPVPFLQELATAIRQQGEFLNRRIHTLAESDAGDPKMVRSRERYGYGLDAQWNDDFHHSLHAVLTGETTGYYADFGRLSQLAQAYQSGYVYTGQFSTYRQRRHGASAQDIPTQGLIVYAQNHDQTGNRMLGERFSTLLPFETQKLAAGAVLLSPFVPLLFMGEEYGEPAPFQYFVSHGDPDLVEAVRNGRHAEFAAFAWRGEAPDPQAQATFEGSKLHFALRQQTPHCVLLAFYTELIRLRKSVPALFRLSKDDLRVECFEPWQLIVLHRWHGEDAALVVLHFGSEKRDVQLPAPPGKWLRVLDSSDTRWDGPGSTLSLTFEGGNTVSLMVSANSVAVFRKG